MPPSPNPLPLKGARARTDKPSPCGRGLGEGLTVPLSRPDLNLAAQDLRNHGAALGGLFAE